MPAGKTEYIKKVFSLRALIVGLLLSLLSVQPVVAEQTAREFDLKAALLYQFSRFISWPEEAIRSQGSFNVCVMGEDPFGQRLEGLKKRKYHEFEINISYPTSKNEASACHILYLVNPDCSLCRELKEPVLLVSSQQGFVDKGGEIEFVQEKGRIRFSINADSIQVKKLRASAKLFEVASRVVGNVSN